jgi:hypothetical protein
MRHGDYKTTLRHYTVLGLVDTARAVNELPAIADERNAHAATGADGNDLDPQQYPQQLPQQKRRGGEPADAASCDNRSDEEEWANTENPEKKAASCHDARHGATLDGMGRGRSSAVERQLPKLNVGSSILLARFSGMGTES